MKRKGIVKGLGLALATCAGLGLASHANADVYGVGSLDITNLNIIFGPSTSPASGGPGLYTFSSDAGATLNGTADTNSGFVTCSATFPSNGSCGTGAGGVPVLTGEVANAPGGATNRGEEDFTVYTQAGGEYSNAESAILTSTLSSGGVDSTAASAISESNLVTGTEAAANTNTQSTTSLAVVFTVVDDGASITIQFDADWLAKAEITAPDEGLAQGSIAFLSSVTGTSGAAAGYATIWNPGSLLISSDLANASELLAGNLNTALSTDEVGSPEENSGSGFFSLTLTNLASGTYSIGLSMETSTLLTRTDVPVPGTLLLMGAGLLAGAGMSRRKKVS